MPWFAGIVMFLLTWILVLFTVLPFNVRTQDEDKDVSWGTEPGAPSQSRIGFKMVVTTGITAVIWVGLNYVIGENLITLDTFPMLLDPTADIR